MAALRWLILSIKEFVLVWSLPMLQIGIRREMNSSIYVLIKLTLREREQKHALRVLQNAQKLVTASTKAESLKIAVLSFHLPGPRGKGRGRGDYIITAEWPE